MTEIRKLGDAFLARRPDALIVVADDHVNAFSFNAVPAMCVRIGRHVNRMFQEEAEAFDRVLDGMPERYALHEETETDNQSSGVVWGYDVQPCRCCNQPKSKTGEAGHQRCGKRRQEKNGKLGPGNAIHGSPQSKRAALGWHAI